MVYYRLATEGCRKAVLSLRRDIGYQRYLTHVYPKLIQDPNRMCVVAMERQEVVGFAASYFYPDGKTALMHSGNVLKNDEGHGHFKGMLEHMFLRIRDRGCTRVFITIENDNKRLDTVLNSEYSLKLIKNVFNYRFDDRKFRACCQGNLDYVTPEYVTTSRHQKAWFPTDYDMVFVTPFKPSEYKWNVSLFRNEGINFYTDTKLNEERTTGLLSAVLVYDTLYIHIFGNESSAIENHILFYLAKYRMSIKTGTNVSIHTHTAIDRVIVDTVLQKNGFSQIPDSTTKRYILEKTL